jgi:hypothetical protein
MSVLRQLACVVRGGHRWEIASDAEGSVTYCIRCDKTRHVGTDFDPPVDPTTTPLPTRSPRSGVPPVGLEG